MVPKTKIAFGWPLLTNISLLQSTGVEDEYTIECAVPGNGVLSIAVGQWLVAGLHWSLSARQSLAARQKELSE